MCIGIFLCERVLCAHICSISFHIMRFLTMSVVFSAVVLTSNNGVWWCPYCGVSSTVMEVFLTGPDFRILASKLTFQKFQALVTPAQICIFWKYKGVNSGFSRHFPDFDPWTTFITVYQCPLLPVCK